jgi:hypothetical protein
VFLSVWVHLGPFHYYTKFEAKWAILVQLMQKFVTQYLVGIILKERSRSTPFDPKHIFWCVSFHFGAFGTFRYCTKLGAKQAKLVQVMKS